jgi:hypothetical protein
VKNSQTGAPRKQLAYDVKLRLTAYIGSNADQLRGKSLREISKVLTKAVGQTFDIATIRRQCDAFGIAYAKGERIGSGAHKNAVSHQQMQEVIIVLETLGDILSRVLDASVIDAAEREKQMLRLINASDTLNIVRKQLVVPPAAGSGSDS